MGMVVVDRGAVARFARHRRLARSPGPRSSRARSSRAAPRSRSNAWLPRIASGELMVGIMVTEPDYGSDVAGVEGDRRRRPTAAGSHQRREDVGDVRGPRRRAHAARAHRSRSLGRAPRPVDLRHREGTRRRPRFAFDDGTAASSKAARSTPSATAACTPTRSRSTTGSCPAENLVGVEAGHRPRLLPADGRLRERPAADRGARRRPHAGRVRSRHRVRAGTQGVRRAVFDYQLVEGEARAHGRAHPGRPAVLVRRRAGRWRTARARSKRRW